VDLVKLTFIFLLLSILPACSKNYQWCGDLTKPPTEPSSKKITDYSQSWTRSQWGSIPSCSIEEYDIDRYKWETYPNPNAVKGSKSFWRGRWFMYCCTHDESTDLKHPFWEFDGPYVVFPD